MAVQISGNDITVPRDGTFSRNVSIAGTLTYEDVTNVDSIGLVTARNGIEVGASPGVAASISVDGNAIFSGITTIGGNVKVGSGVTLSPDGDIFATGVTTSTTFVGNLTGNVTGNSDTATTATNATHISVADNESTNENNLIPFIEDASVELHEPRSKRIAGYSGVRVAKGIYIGGSQARSYQEMRRLDSGKLKLTFNELLFMGDLETRTIELKRIMDIEPYIDGFKLSIKNRQKPIVFTGVKESGSWSMVIYLLRSLSSQHTRKQTLDLDVVNREIDDIVSEIDTQIAIEQRELDT